MKCSNKYCHDGIEFIACCSGSECGCMGQLVAASNCKECNKENREPTDEQVIQEMQYLEWLGD
ncbi:MULTISPECIES: hypothetical protein [Morganellaceae]|uniref:Uncharacterized protein n=1 Tax=Moellerella wisconsensis TaxID=158849 RepID=A0A9Q8Q262_9GAMM|nr:MULTISPECIES: hypothetical protein [Morganellaceae]NIH23425.1 hypothetical protein [Providencia heimbachae]UNH31658.1 hypothetical protein MNY72_05015 [Moellerella wisconsensis]